MGIYLLSSQRCTSAGKSWKAVKNPNVGCWCPPGAWPGINFSQNIILEHPTYTINIVYYYPALKGGEGRFSCYPQQTGSLHSPTDTGMLDQTGAREGCICVWLFPASWILRKTRFVSNNKPEGQIEAGRTQSCNFQPRCGFYPSPFSLQAYSRFTNNWYTPVVLHPLEPGRKHSSASQIAGDSSEQELSILIFPCHPRIAATRPDHREEKESKQTNQLPASKSSPHKPRR